MKEKDVKEKALNAEKLRLNIIRDSLDKVTHEYGREKNAWSTKEKEYLSKMSKMSLSLESGKRFIKRLENELSK